MVNSWISRIAFALVIGFLVTDCLVTDALVTDSLVTGPIQAADFRLESRVYDGEATDEVEVPTSRNLTIFSKGLVYDFLGDSEEVTIYDTQRQIFRLLLPQAKLRTEVLAEEAVEFEKGLQAWASAQKDRFLRFTAVPEFETVFDAETKTLSLSHEYLKYEAHGIAGGFPQAVNQWRDYCDSFARLNALTHPGGIPPFPRLVLNRELAERNLVADQIQLTIPEHSIIGGEDRIVRSQHQFFWRIRKADHQLVAA